MHLAQRKYVYDLFKKFMNAFKRVQFGLLFVRRTGGKGGMLKKPKKRKRVKTNIKTNHNYSWAPSVLSLEKN